MTAVSEAPDDPLVEELADAVEEPPTAPAVAPNHPLRAQDVPALLAKRIG